MKIVQYSSFDVLPTITASNTQDFKVFPGKVIVITQDGLIREVAVPLTGLSLADIGDAVHCNVTVPAGAGAITAAVVKVAGDPAGKRSASGGVYSVPLARLTHTGIIQRHSGDIVLYLASPEHSWKTTVRKNGTAWAYMVAAGGVINPNGTLTTVTEKAWSAIATGTMSLKLSYGSATPTPTFGFSVGSSALGDNPAIVVIPLAKIEGNSTTGYSVTQYQHSDIVLAGAEIPPAITGYAAGSKQLLVHEENAGMSLVTFGEEFACP